MKYFTKLKRTADSNQLYDYYRLAKPLKHTYDGLTTEHEYLAIRYVRETMLFADTRFTSYWEIRGLTTSFVGNSITYLPNSKPIIVANGIVYPEIEDVLEELMELLAYGKVICIEEKQYIPSSNMGIFKICGGPVTLDFNHIDNDEFSIPVTYLAMSYRGDKIIINPAEVPETNMYQHSIINIDVTKEKIVKNDIGIGCVWTDDNSVRKSYNRVLHLLLEEQWYVSKELYKNIRYLDVKVGHKKESHA